MRRALRALAVASSCAAALGCVLRHWPARAAATSTAARLTDRQRHVEDWKQRREIWINQHYPDATPRRFQPRGGCQAPLDSFVSGYGAAVRFQDDAGHATCGSTAKQPDGEPFEVTATSSGRGGLATRSDRIQGKQVMARLKSELEVHLSVLPVDARRRPESRPRRLAQEPERGNKPELSDAQRILAEEAARREAIFQQSVDAEKTRGDALSRRFEEALQAGATRSRSPSRRATSISTEAVLSLVHWGLGIATDARIAHLRRDLVTPVTRDSRSATEIRRERRPALPPA